jgi:hypothetical protein
LFAKTIPHWFITNLNSDLSFINLFIQAISTCIWHMQGQLPQ